MLRSDRLHLREFRDDDFEAVHAYATDLEVVRYMPWGPNSEADTRAFLKRAQGHDGVDPRVGFELAIVREDTGKLIGGIGLHVDGSSAMLGYCLARPDWGKGFATEAAGLLLGFGFESLGVHRTWAGCDSENGRSVRVLQKLGMTQEGHFRQNCQIRGEWRDTLVFAVLAHDWPPRR